ncbi:MAG TPA: hypothetical protein VKA30_07775, partial [Actinomycetota bacterium]|nr:hypothetical protein [Actinomycetota bacterium]
MTDRAEGDAPARAAIAVADQGVAMSWQTRTESQPKRPARRFRKSAPPVGETPLVEPEAQEAVVEALVHTPTAEPEPAPEPVVEPAVAEREPPEPEPVVEAPAAKRPRAARRPRAATEPRPATQPLIPPPPAETAEGPASQRTDEPNVRRLSWPARTPTQERLHPDAPPVVAAPRRPFPWRWIGVPFAVVAILLGGVAGAIVLKPYLLPERAASTGPVLTVAAMRPEVSSRKFEVTVANASNHPVTAECTAGAVNPSGTKE